MAEAAALIQRSETDADFAVWAAEIAFEPGEVREVSELDSEMGIRARAASLFGKVATGAMSEVSQGPPAETMTLMEAIHRAYTGDQMAEKMVETNVATDVIERSIKAGHIMKVNLELNERGQLLQYGQTAEAIQENSLRFASGSPQMRERTEAEARNMYRIEELNRRGMLKDYVFVVFSRAADNMSDAAMEEVGFFVDTMSVAIQATTLEGDGTITTESAFVAGKRNRQAERKDREVLGQLGDTFGVDYRGKTAAQTLDMPVLIHKDFLKNGVVDVVSWWDAAAGGTFFGQDKPRQDYLEYLDKCREREAELKPTVDQIVAQIVDEAVTITTPVAATRRLHKLSEAALLKRALTDDKIDGMVFGAEAAFFLAGARRQMEEGDWDGVNRLMQRAQNVAKSRSCPTAGAEVSDGSDASSEKDDADCDYISKSCPLCGMKNVLTRDTRVAGNIRRVHGACGCSKTYVKEPSVVPVRSEFSLAA